MTVARTVVGCMSGTSMDGVDAALVRVEGEGLALHCSLMDFASADFVGRDLLAACAGGAPLTAAQLASLTERVTSGHIEAIERLQQVDDASLFVIHGQTVYHSPPQSIQLLNPWPIVARWKRPLLFDLRGADLAMGGQGAPITPIADWVLFRSNTVGRAVVNLGGFVNVTLLPSDCRNPAEGVTGRDVCPCNHVLNAVAAARLGLPFDTGGHTASSGRADPSVVESLQAMLCTHGLRSLGTGDEQIAGVLEMVSRLSDADALASACAAVARSIAASVGDTPEVIVAGGGAKNQRLIDELSRSCSGSVLLSDSLGVPVQAREAVCMAVLGALAQDGVPIHLPRVTGASGTLTSGCWIRP